jgi:hypothetical protein
VKKRVRVPHPPQPKRSRNFYKEGSRRRRHPTTLHTLPETGPDQRTFLPTLVFKRDALQWMVPAVKIPLYWFDTYMIRRKLVTPVPPDIFIADGRRFKAIAQDFKIIGVGFSRWLCYEEAAIPKGTKL